MAGRVHSFAAYCLVAGLLVLPALRGFAVTFSVEETWDSGTASWSCIDELNPPGTIPLNNSASFLRATLPAQSMSFPRVCRVQANYQSSGGKFVGDYSVVGSVRVLFKLYLQDAFPEECRLYFCSATNENRWWFPLSTPAIGQWMQYDITLNYYDGWTTDTGPSVDKFMSDIKNVAWIGIRLRDDSISSHSYGLDDFVVTSPLLDSDDDGINDYAELISGTDPFDPNSGLRILSISTPPNRVYFTFQSVIGNNYEIGRSTNLRQGFQYLPIPPVLATNILTTHEDTTATGNWPYFYNVRLKKP